MPTYIDDTTGRMIPRVVDIFRGDKVLDKFKGAAEAGVWAIIHKATQGTTIQDATYEDRRQWAYDQGLKWGAYHFNSAENPSKQAKAFLAKANLIDDDLAVLDFEANSKGCMTMNQAVDFLDEVEQTIGRKAAIYSGNLLKENIHKLNSDDMDYILNHRLWLCQYGPRAVLPQGFKKWWLWQYTGDGVGPKPWSVPGIECFNAKGINGIDLNVYDGTREELEAEWAGAPTQISQ